MKKKKRIEQLERKLSITIDALKYIAENSFMNEREYVEKAFDALVEIGEKGRDDWWLI